MNYGILWYNYERIVFFGMEKIFLFIIICWFVFNVVIPALLVLFVIRYIFNLRQRQNDEFLDALGYVVHDAVLDALKDNESAKRYTKTTQTNYNLKK